MKYKREMERRLGMDEGKAGNEVVVGLTPEARPGSLGGNINPAAAAARPAPAPAPGQPAPRNFAAADTNTTSTTAAPSAPPAASGGGDGDIYD